VLDSRPDVIVRALGMGCEPELQTWNVHAGDALLITSEVHSFVPQDELNAVVAGTWSASQEMVDTLVSMAVDRGAPPSTVALFVPL
jgi:hypothetical protein